MTPNLRSVKLRPSPLRTFTTFPPFTRHISTHVRTNKRGPAHLHVHHEDAEHHDDPGDADGVEEEVRDSVLGGHTASEGV